MFREVLQGRRLGLRALLAAAIATFALGAATSTAAAAPSVTVTPDTGLVTGTEISVEGQGFVPPTPVTNPPAGLIGLYAAQVAVVDDEYVIGTAQQWIRPAGFGGAGETLLNNDGSFSTTLEVSRTIGSGADQVDCAKVECIVMTWQAHGNPGDPNNPVFTTTPLGFSASTLLVDPKLQLSPIGQTDSTVAGRNFLPEDFPDGFNVAQGQEVSGAYSVGPHILVTESPDPLEPQEIQLNPNGTFVGEVPLQAKFAGSAGEVDCEIAPCQVIAWPAGESPTAGSASNVVGSQAISFEFTYDPTATLDPAGELDGDTEVKVTGEGFPPAQPGVYVSQIATVDGKIVTPPAGPGGSAGGETKYVRPNGPTADQTLNADGSFETSINVEENFTTAEGQEVDCKVADCAVATWRAHTDPTRRSLYTVERLRFKMPEPGVAPAANVVNRMTFRTGRKPRKLNLVAVRCGSEDCTIAKSKRAFVRVGKRKVPVRVTGPNRVAAGERAVFGVVINRRVIRQLINRKGVLRFGIAARSATGNERALVGKVLVGPRHRR